MAIAALIEGWTAEQLAEFEDAVVRLTAQTEALEDLTARIEAVVNETDNGGNNDANNDNDNTNDNGGDNNGNDNAPTLPQTGFVVANTTLSGIALVGLGAIVTVAKNKKNKFFDH